MTNETAQIILNINAGSEADEQELEMLSRQLREELMELDVESVDLVRVGEKPVGAKVGEPISWGAILITLFATGGVVTTLIKTIESWLSRHERCSLTLELNGDKLEIKGISLQERQKLIDAWIARHTKP